MEFRLLKERFPDDPLTEECGDLLSEFFCARTVGSHSYEGRLFLTEKALFFVSTFSAATCYDKSFGVDQIQQVIAYQRFIPLIEIILTEGKEEFTNFHDLNKTTGVLKELLPAQIQVEIKKQALLSRLVSVPSKDQSKDHTPIDNHTHSFTQAKPITCPYFSQNGFCPRQEFCHLCHEPNPPVSHVTKHKLSITKPELLRSISSPAYTSGGGGSDPSQREDKSSPDLLPYEEVRSKEDSDVTKPHDATNEEGISQEELTADKETVSSSEEMTADEKNGRVKRKKGAADIFDTRSVSESQEEVMKLDGSVPVTPPLSSPPPYSGFYYEYGSSDEYNEDIPLVEMPKQLLVYPASAIGRADINSGDKIILSPDILMACEQRELSYPMAFCLENKSENKLVHAGVLEFSSPQTHTAYLPQWMFEHLCVDEGFEVSFEHVELPKGTFVQLQPVSSAWLSIPHDKSLSIMEFQLRNFQTLTVGTKVTIVYELNRYSFKVLKCKPAIGISIVDADLKTDIVEPADFNRFHSIEEWQAEHIPLDEPVHCILPAGQYRHFVLLSLSGQELPSCLRVEVKQETGDPDLFLCQTCSTPSQTRYTWCCQDYGDATIRLSTEDNFDTKKCLFTGVVSLCEDTSFTICFHSENVIYRLAPPTESSGHVLRSATGSSGVSSLGEDEDMRETDSIDPVVVVPPGHEQCSYCGSIMPQLRLLMHQRHCAQSTFKCPTCKQCFAKSMEKKHQLIAHELLTCECGQELSQLSLHHHQLTECIKRSVQCNFKWCKLSYPLDQMENHESMCCRKLVSCPVCSEEVSQLELEMHLEGLHSVDVDKLDWTIPISSQSLTYKEREPGFICHCGAGFEYEDDYQVHQLTDCSVSPCINGSLEQPQLENSDDNIEG